MLKKSLLIALFTSLIAAAAFAGANPGPCEQIKQACTNAGFIKGEAKEGKGLWRDCIDPIVQGTTAKKSVLALPTVDPSVVSACKAKHPKFGEGKVGN
jgi:hypothetical protein